MRGLLKTKRKKRRSVDWLREYEKLAMLRLFQKGGVQPRKSFIHKDGKRGEGQRRS